MFSDKIVYQIYPKSFSDSDGDGIGDLQGIINRLDYLENLGVDMIWITPFFISPQNDNGYDVADYLKIDPLFGDMSTFDLLLSEAKKRNIELMLDMVLNHSSTKHEWFQKALKGKKKYIDYYFFKEEPVNWQSKFGGNAFEYVEDLKLYYLHLFDKTQADLNWENPEVFKELCHIVNFWLDKGVTGLRFDVVNLVSKPDVFEDDFEGDGRKFYTDGPRIHEHLHNLNKHTFGKHPEVLTVGEMSSTSIENGVKYADPTREELSTIFNFHHLKVDYENNQKWHPKPFDFIELKEILSTWQLATQEKNALLALFLNNHDQPRSVSRFTGTTEFHEERAKMLAAAVQLMRGIVYIYQGEEIGLPNADFKDISSYRDIESLNTYRLLKGTDEEKLEILSKHSRDNGRTPMPWNDSKFYGFSTKEPWVPFSESSKLTTVEENLNNKESIFNFYKKVISLKKELSVLSSGTIEFKELDHQQLFIYERKLNGEKTLHIHNFYESKVKYKFSYDIGMILLSNYDRIKVGKNLVLDAFEVLVIKIG